MSIEDDVALLERVPTLRLLGTAALRMLAIGSEQREVARGTISCSMPATMPMPGSSFSAARSGSRSKTAAAPKSSPGRAR
jgi:hypothetical protein